MENYSIKTLHSGGGIIVTYKCSAACMHCCYSSSPKRSSDYMSKEQAKNIFKTLREMGCLSVHIGGGEPFMNFEKLLGVCHAAHESGVEIDYIETNASWAVLDERTCEHLYKLQNSGVSCLLISLDPFHNEFVEYEKIKNLLKCCKKTGMSTFVWQSHFERIVSAFDASSTHELREYIDEYGRGFVKAVMDSYGLGINGRAIRLADAVREMRPHEFYLKRNDPCSSINSSHHFHVDVNDNYIPSGCVGFQVNINDLRKILPRDKYANFLSAAEGGIRDLYSRAISLGFEPKQEGYSHKCSLCFDIKKYILEKTNAEDIGPREFFYE